MRLEDLAILRAVVADGGITRAAARLHRVPSGVTARIQDLERELGRPLFHRRGRNLVPTPAGVAAAAQAGRVLAEAEALRATVAERPAPTRLRLGTLESTAALRMPAALARLQRERPEVAIELLVANGRELLSQLLAGDIDAALVADLPADARLSSRQLFTDTLVLIAPDSHSPIRRPTDVVKPVLIVFRPGCAYRARLEAWCARGRLVPDRLVEVGSFHAVVGCVAAGMGIALVPEPLVAIHPGRAHISLHPLPTALRRIRHAMAWCTGRPNDAADLLCGMIA